MKISNLYWYLDCLPILILKLIILLNKVKTFIVFTVSFNFVTTMHFIGRVTMLFANNSLMECLITMKFTVLAKSMVTRPMKCIVGVCYSLFSQKFCIKIRLFSAINFALRQFIAKHSGFPSLINNYYYNRENIQSL